MQSTAKRERKRRSGPRAKRARAAVEDAAQAIALAQAGGRILITGAAGTGKTYVLARRMLSLLEEREVPARHVLGLTMTTDGVERLMHLASSLSASGGGLQSRTFRSLAFLILREHHRAAGLPQDFRVATGRDKIRLLRGAFDLGEAKARYYIQKIGLCKRQRRVPALDAGFEDVFAAYAALLRDEALVDADDLIGHAVDLLAADADLCSLYRARFRYVFVDNYQDVDTTAQRLLRLLAPANLCVAGDPMQTVDSASGADMTHLLRFQQHFPDVKQVRLCHNHRSGAHIVQAAEAVRKRAPVGDTAAPAVTRESTGHISVHETTHAHAEAQFVTRHISEAIGAGVGAPADFAVLARSVEQLEPLVEALQAAHIPVLLEPTDDDADLQGDHKVAAQAANAVTLSTLRAARGSTYRTVFITGCEAGLLPLALPGGDAYEPPEERRLFYIGVSCAQDRLILTHAKRRSVRGRARSNPPSPYLAELPAATLATPEPAPSGKAPRRAAAAKSTGGGRGRPREQLRLW